MPLSSLIKRRRQTPRSYWLPNDQGRRILYTMIHKNGSTPFRYYIMTRTGHPFSSRATRQLISKNPSPERSEYDAALFVYRDPFERAVSGYINKFVDKVGTNGVYKNYQQYSEIAPQDSSFLDFLTYIVSSKDNVDGHFIPQHDHLLPIDYTHPIPVKHINRTMDRLLGTQEGSEMFMHKANATQYGTHGFDGICDTPADELQRIVQSGQRLQIDAFKTPETQRIIGEIYSQDYEMIRDIEALPDGASYMPHPNTARGGVS